MMTSHDYIRKQISFLKVQINKLKLHTLSRIQASQVQGGGVPTGMILPYVGTNIIDGYLKCDGSQYNVEEYPILYDVLMTIDETIRTTWGEADWETTFVVPNLTDVYLRGAGVDIGALQDEGLPNITGAVYGDGYNRANSIFWGNNGGALRSARYYPGSNIANYSNSGAGNNASEINIDASRSSTIYGKSQHVTPKNIGVQYMIKT